MLSREAPLQSLLTISENHRANLFYGVCPRFGPNGQFDLSWQIRTFRVLWADLDHCMVENALKRGQDAGLPRPSIVVSSGNGIHLYWVLAEPFLIDEVGPPPAVLTEWIDQGPDKRKRARKYIKGEDGQRIYLRLANGKTRNPDVPSATAILAASCTMRRTSILLDFRTPMLRISRLTSRVRTAIVLQTRPTGCRDLVQNKDGDSFGAGTGILLPAGLYSDVLLGLEYIITITFEVLMPTRRRKQTRFGARLFLFRRQAYISREELARRSGTSAHSIQSWEQGRPDRRHRRCQFLLEHGWSPTSKDDDITRDAWGFRLDLLRCRNDADRERLVRSYPALAQVHLFVQNATTLQRAELEARLLANESDGNRSRARGRQPV
jgi:transcriptional regulator with XRE-family HTH domain